MKRVLIIEDDPAFLQSVSQLLSAHFEPIAASSGAEGIRLACEHKPHLILVDLRMPEIDGFEVCRRLRGKLITRDIPIIMLTGEGETESRVMGLELGADDYVTKPFEARELIARINARLRRSESDRKLGERLEAGNLVFDPKSSEVTVGGASVELTQIEVRLLQYFLEHANELISRERLLGDLWPDAVVSSRTIDTHVAHLRRKLKGFSGEIKTIFRAGYMVRTAPRSSEAAPASSSEAPSEDREDR
ncbi:MAG: response regulator transcription factor [Oligoflexia bacterium]|nr:response regulator transcription factor [Oligoflexia bacterium]